MGRIEDVAAEMRTAGLTLGDHMVYTICIDALPAECEVEARNLAYRDSIGRDDIIKTVRERHHRRPGNRKKGAYAKYISHDMYASGGGGSREKDGDGGKGKGGKQGKHGHGGRGTNENGGGSAAVAAAMAAVPKPAKIVPPC